MAASPSLKALNDWSMTHARCRLSVDATDQNAVQSDATLVAGLALYLMHL